MRAFAIPEGGSTELSEIDIPTPDPQGTEVLLTVIRSGVCHTDPHLRAGYYDLGRRGHMRLTDRGVPYPLVMGHEVVGVVAAAGPDAPGVEIGRGQATCRDRFDRPIQKPSIVDSRGASGSVAAPSVTNSGTKCSTVGCA